MPMEPTSPWPQQPADASHAPVHPDAVTTDSQATGLHIPKETQTYHPASQSDEGHGVAFRNPDYQILGVLGRGGMGIVFKARQLRADRIVALKMTLNADHATPTERERFLIEAQAGAGLDHPHIAKVFEVGEDEGRLFFALEYCSGGSLADQLREQPLVPRKAAEIMEKLARAVAAAHHQQIIHRDLKPANVLLTETGEPKITDFGLAKRLDRDSGQTKSNAVMGTPSYMSPEQAFGEARNVTPAADIYSLGAILYDCLCGRPPFRGATLLDTLEQVRNQEPVAPREFNQAIPRDLETICLKALQKDPRKRYASGEAMAEDVKRFLNHEPILARPVGRMERIAKWGKRNPALAVVGTLAVLGLVSAVVVSVVFALAQRDNNTVLVAKNNDISDQKKTIQEEQTRTQKALSESIQLQGLSAEMMYHQGLDFCEKRDITRGLLWLARSLEQTPDTNPRLQKQIRQAIADWVQHHPRALAIFEHDSPVVGAMFHPSGKLLLTFGGNSAQLWDVDPTSPTFGQRRGNPMKHTGKVEVAQFSPNGIHVAIGSREPGEIHIWSCGTPTKPISEPFFSPTPTNSATVYWLNWSKNGSVLLSSDSAPTITIWSIPEQPGKQPLVAAKAIKLPGDSYDPQINTKKDYLFMVASGEKLEGQLVSLATRELIGEPIIATSTTGNSHLLLDKDAPLLYSTTPKAVEIRDLHPESKTFLKVIKRVEHSEDAEITSLLQSGRELYITFANGELWRVSVHLDDPEFGKRIGSPIGIGRSVYLMLPFDGYLVIFRYYRDHGELSMVNPSSPAQVVFEPIEIPRFEYPPSRDTESHDLFLAGFGKATRWSTHDGIDRHAPFPTWRLHQLIALPQPKGNLVATFAPRSDRQVHLWRTDLVHDHHVELNFGRIITTSLTQDGKWLAGVINPNNSGEEKKGQNSQLVLAGTRDGKQLHRWTTKQETIGHLLFSRDATTLVAIGDQGCEVFDLDQKGGKVPTLRIRLPETKEVLALDSTGTRLVAFSPRVNGEESKIVEIWDLDPHSPTLGQRLAKIPPTDGAPLIPEFSPSGKWISGVANFKRSLLYDRNGKRVGEIPLKLKSRDRLFYTRFLGEDFLWTAYQERTTEQIVLQQWTREPMALKQTIAFESPPTVGSLDEFRATLDIIATHAETDRASVNAMLETLRVAAKFEGNGTIVVPEQWLKGQSDSSGKLQWKDAITLRKRGLPLGRNAPGHGDYIQAIQPDGSYWLVDQATATRYRLPLPIRGTPEEVRKELEHRCGFRLNPRGELAPITVTDWQRLK